MKCPKCKTGNMVPETDFTGRKISQRCFICGERIYSDFTIRPPAATETNGEGARLNTPRRMLTPAEKALILAKHAEGISMRQIAKQLNRSESVVVKYIKKEASHV